MCVMRMTRSNNKKAEEEEEKNTKNIKQVCNIFPSGIIEVQCYKVWYLN